MPYVLDTGPTTEPVALEDLTAHCRVEITTDDDLIAALGIAARERVELDTGRALCTQTWILYGSAFPASSTRPINLDHPPLQSATITYTDTAGTAATWAVADYQVDTASVPGRNPYTWSTSGQPPIWTAISISSCAWRPAWPWWTSPPPKRTIPSTSSSSWTWSRLTSAYATASSNAYARRS